MKLRKLSSLPLHTAAIAAVLFFQIDSCFCAAPEDLPPNCASLALLQAYQRPLLDSCCYNALLPANQGDASTSTWSVVNESWTAASAGEAGCLQHVMICNSSDWLITQYINTTLDSGSRASEVQVNIRCTNDCPATGLNLWYYSTNNTMLDRKRAVPESTFTLVGQVVDGNNNVSGLTNMDGFYLALQASSVCVTIEQISIIPRVCSETTTNLVILPYSYAVNSPVTVQCLDNSEPSGSEALTATCENNGQWTTTISCVCSAGYFLDDDVCSACPVGTYKDMARNEACTTCPANSAAQTMGNRICDCETNYTRPTSASASQGCTECVANYFLDGGSCMQCPDNSRSLIGGADHCNCNPNHTTMNGSMTTNGERCVCQADYFVDGSGQCVQCPTNSHRAVMSSVDSCMCDTNRRTPDGMITTSGAPGCIGCAVDYFMMGTSCMRCPDNSNNEGPQSESCGCAGNSVTMEASNTTSIAGCTNCRVDWKSVSTSPLSCQPCENRSERPFDADISTCTCIDNYEKGTGSNAEVCLVRVSIPSAPLLLKEGSAANGASFLLNLSANSFDILDVIINVDAMFRDHVSPYPNVKFGMGIRHADVTVTGNDVALDTNYIIEINVIPNDAYVGNGTLKVEIEDDDSVGVGFMATQPLVFKESIGVISISLTKNVSTAQDIMVNVTITPEGSSVSVKNPVTLPSGPPGNISVSFLIQDDANGGEEDESISLDLQLVSPMEFSHLIDLDTPSNDATNQITITIMDDDPPPIQDIDLGTVIGIAAGGGGVAVLLVLILLVSVCICICRFNVNRQGFYVTDEDKTTNPPSMLRYSASLRSISSQTVIPIIDGKGQIPFKENEFYV